MKRVMNIKTMNVKREANTQQESNVVIVCGPIMGHLTENNDSFSQLRARG